LVDVQIEDKWYEGIVKTVTKKDPEEDIYDLACIITGKDEKVY
jgi:hypothetical protein